MVHDSLLDPSSIPGWGKSPGEGIGYPLQYSWSSLVAQMVMNLPAMRDTWVQPLGWEYPLEDGMATHTVFLPRESHEQRSLMGYSTWGSKEWDRTERLTLSLSLFSSVQFSCSVVSDTLRPHEPQHARPPCPSLTPGVHPNACPLSR